MLSTYLNFAIEAAWQAGRITLGYFQTALEVEQKADLSPVTVADRAAETRLRELIGKTWAGHGIIGEEFGRSEGTQPLTWVIDPIDGTKSFTHGVPFYGVLLALLEHGVPQLGVAHFPALGETLYAARGSGCFLNGRAMQVNTMNTLSQATLLSSEVRMKVSEKDAAYRRLVEATRIQRTWGDAYGYLMVASGRAEIMLDAKMEIWDCAPFGVILEEAGGTFTDWRGNQTITGGDSIATNGVLYKDVMNTLQSGTPQT